MENCVNLQQRFLLLLDLEANDRDVLFPLYADISTFAGIQAHMHVLYPRTASRGFYAFFGLPFCRKDFLADGPEEETNNVSEVFGGRKKCFRDFQGYIEEKNMNVGGPEEETNNVSEVFGGRRKMFQGYIEKKNMNVGSPEEETNNVSEVFGGRRKMFQGYIEKKNMNVGGPEEETNNDQRQNQTCFKSMQKRKA